ncbi:MAG: hypothetical protein AAF723_10495 [Pseudomonadota bacterium]
MKASREEAEVVIHLSQDEALVLFDWLADANGKDLPTYHDQSEKRVLWDLECILEKQIETLFSKDYHEKLAAARLRVGDNDG